MEDTLIKFETAKLAKERGFDINGQDVFDLKNNNKIINFKDLAVQEFIKDVETGYRDKALNYLKENINRTDDNSDEEYYLLAPTQSLLAKWLREKYDIEINITRMPPEAIKSSFNKGNKRIKKYNMWVWSLNGNPRIENPSLFFDNYEEAFEIGLQEALKLIK